jgi:hypothetical protein
MTPVAYGRCRTLSQIDWDMTIQSGEEHVMAGHDRSADRTRYQPSVDQTAAEGVREQGQVGLPSIVTGLELHFKINTVLIILQQNGV